MRRVGRLGVRVLGQRRHQWREDRAERRQAAANRAYWAQEEARRAAEHAAYYARVDALMASLPGGDPRPQKQPGYVRGAIRIRTHGIAGIPDHEEIRHDA